MGRRLVQLADHPAHLLQLLHQVVLGMQASGGIGDQHVDAAGLGGLHRVEDHRGGVGAGVLGDHRDAVALAPDLQLLHGGGAEGVAGGQHDLLALELQLLRQLADGGGLAHAVHPDHQDHIGLARDVDLQRLLHRAQQAGQLFLQRLVQRAAVGQLLARHALGQVLHDQGGGLDADVGGQQARLDVVEQVVVDFLATEEQAGHAFADAGAGLGQPLPEAGEEARPGRRLADCRSGGQRRNGLGLGLGLGSQDRLGLRDGRLGPGRMLLGRRWLVTGERCFGNRRRLGRLGSGGLLPTWLFCQDCATSSAGARCSAAAVSETGSTG